MFLMIGRSCVLAGVVGEGVGRGGDSVGREGELSVGPQGHQCTSDRGLGYSVMTACRCRSPGECYLKLKTWSTGGKIGARCLKGFA